jgi:proteasome activator subunit 4
MASKHVEVRSKASEVLGGLLHCAFVDKERSDILLKSFYAKVRGKKKKKQKSSTEDIVTKHSGVLGLCAFVNAFPYDVPDFVPDILMVLSDHLHDPQPIPMTIKKTLQDFKRTHQDNWQDHKQKFSDDQLAVLTDLLVSPSYYA